MLSKAKLFVASALSFLFLILFGWIKYLSNKNESLENKVETLEKNEIIKKEVDKVETKIQQSLDTVRKESEVIHNENTKKRINKVRPNIGDSFNDKRIK
jgi:chaperonin cofactor prefoldin